MNVIPIHIPALRHRREDIPLLVNHFLKINCDRYDKEMRFSNKALAAMSNYSWRGNIRELENTVERLVLTVPRTIITAEELPDFIINQEDECTAIKVDRIISLDQAMTIVEKELYQMAINEYGTMAKAADVLGVNQSTVSRKLAQYNIKRSWDRL